MAELNTEQEYIDSMKLSQEENVISSIYKSMSDVIGALNTDNMLLKTQFKKIQELIDCVQNEMRELSCIYTGDLSTINDKLLTIPHDFKELETNMMERLNNLQKQILDTRGILLQTISNNMIHTKKEISDIHKLKDEIRLHIFDDIKDLVASEIKKYTDKKFDDLARENRTVLANHIRKSSIQRDTSYIVELIKQHISEMSPVVDINQLKQQQLEFMHKIEGIVSVLNEKLREQYI